MRSPDRLRIVDHAGCGAGRLVAYQRSQHARGVGIAASAGIVLGVGDDDRLTCRFRQLHREAHAVIGRIDAAVEIVLVALHQRHQFVGCGIRIGLRPAVGKHARPAIPEVRRWETRRKRQRRHRVTLQRRKLLVNALGRLVVGALPGDRDQERQLSERFCKTLPRLRHQREVSCTGAAGVGHVDVRVGTVGNESIRMLHHLGRDIGMEVEAHDQR